MKEREESTPTIRATIPTASIHRRAPICASSAISSDSCRSTDTSYRGTAHLPSIFMDAILYDSAHGAFRPEEQIACMFQVHERPALTRPRPLLNLVFIHAFCYNATFNKPAGGPHGGICSRNPLRAFGLIEPPENCPPINHVPRIVVRNS
jgi:hypothetical protein